MTTENELKSERGLAWFLGVPLHQLRELAASPDFQYRPFTRRRKGKKPREIDNPKAHLKGVQRAIRSRVLAPHPVDESARACVKGGSPLKHALAVSGSRNVAETDLKNCYPKMSNEMAFRLFRSLGFGRDNASLLTRLTTWEGHLPQGAPTSDMIANLVLRPLDERAKAIAARHGLKYSRCMDGFVLAGDDTRQALREVIAEILKAKLAVGRKKTFNAGKGHPQPVAGLNVNTPFGPKLPKTKVQQIRSTVLNVIQAHLRGEDVRQRMLSVDGKLAYLRRTNPGHARRLENQLATAGLRGHARATAVQLNAP
jgi:RNA-directed DNA polymerase